MGDPVSEILQRVAELSVDDDHFDELVGEVHKLGPLAPLSVGTVLEPGTTLYRGTTHHASVPARIEEIWDPPPERVTKFARANRPGSPVFYCCSDPAGAFLEVRAVVGGYAVLAQWATTRRAALHDVGYSAEVFQRAAARRQVPVGHAEFTGKLSPGAREVRDYLARAFTEPNASPEQYRITAAIAEFHLASDEVDGLLYPAVMNVNVDNLALLPRFVRTGLQLVRADLIKVESPDAGLLSGLVVARLNAIREGRLTWDFTADRTTTIPPLSSVRLVVKPGETLRVTTAGRLVLAGRIYDLREGYSIELVEGAVVVKDLQDQVVAPES